MEDAIWGCEIPLHQPPTGPKIRPSINQGTVPMKSIYNEGCVLLLSFGVAITSHHSQKSEASQRFHNRGSRPFFCCSAELGPRGGAVCVLRSKKKAS